MTVKIKKDHFVGIRVPTSLLSQIDAKAGRGGLSEYIRSAVIEKLRRDQPHKTN